MGKPAWVGLVSAIVLALVCGGIYAFNERADVAKAQPDTTVGVDANPAGNTATSLATINSCISVESVDTGPGVPGPTFYIDLFVSDVTDLNDWQVTFRFDESVLEIDSLAVAGFFLGSSTYDPIFSCTPGECLLGTFDTTGAGHTGEGVLGRLELTAIGTGTSKANIDLRAEGSLASGIVLRDGEGNPIGSIDADEFFDGSGCFDGSTCLNAEIRVDGPCPGKCEPGVDTDGDGFNDDLECYLPTDQDDDCPNNPSHDAWPLDIDMDTYVTVVGDVLEFAGLIGSAYGDGNWTQRLDLDRDGFITVVGDVLEFAGRIGDECS